MWKNTKMKIQSCDENNKRFVPACCKACWNKEYVKEEVHDWMDELSLKLACGCLSVAWEFKSSVENYIMWENLLTSGTGVRKVP